MQSFALQFEVQSNLLKALFGSPWNGRGGDGAGVEGISICKQWSLCIYISVTARTA